MADLDEHEVSPQNNIVFEINRSESNKTLDLLTQIYKDYIKNRDYHEGSFSCEPIEDSNMNLVLKVCIDDHNWLIKHADPWVRKYPHIAAPVSRTSQEAKFYEAFGSNPKLRHLMPDYIGFNPSDNILALKFVEQSISAMSLYNIKNSKGIPNNLLQQAISYLAKLQSITPPQSEDWSNLELRKLNHTHMFEFPFNPDNGMDLNEFCPGLKQLANSFHRDHELKKSCMALGHLYMKARGPALLHGDFYPGSWLIKDSKVIVIDPEFCFLGPVEFDLGILLAHHLIIGGSSHELASLIEGYKKQIDSSFFLDQDLCLRFCGAEVLRRLLGAAQLPINWGLDRYEAMLKLGREYCIQ